MEEQKQESEGVFSSNDFSAEAVMLKAYRDAVLQGDAEAAESAMMRFMTFACEQAEKEPSRDLLLKMEAHHCEMQANWQKAEAAYGEALTLAQSENNYWLECKAYVDLSRLYGFLGQDEEALTASRAATAAARRTNMDVLLGMALEGEAAVLLQVERVPEALSVAEEMLQLLPDTKMKHLQRARALILRARCHAAAKNVTASDADLKAAWPLLQPMAGVALFAGVQSGLASWWATSASLKSSQGDFQDAANAWRKAVEHRREVAAAPQLEGPYKYRSLADALRCYGQALLAVEDVSGAEQALEESRSLREAIGLT